jgi:hypothetical protein
MDSNEHFKISSSSRKRPSIHEEHDEDDDEEFKRIRAHRMADSKRRAKLSSLFNKLHQVTHDEQFPNETEASKPKQGAILQNAIDEIERLKQELYDYEVKLDAANKHSARISQLTLFKYLFCYSFLWSLFPVDILFLIHLKSI